jgi:hypothetical protein
MILGYPDVSPSAHVQVGIGTHSEIRPMHVFMSTIRGEPVGTAIELRDVGAKSFRIEFDDSRHGARIPVRMRKMGTEPILRDMRIGIGVGKPNAPWIKVLEML